MLRFEPIETGLRLRHDLEGPIQQIGVQPVMAVHFAVTAQTQDIGVLDLPKVILGLGIGKAEHHVLVGLAVDMRDSKGIAIDRHAAREPRRFGLLRGAQAAPRARSHSTSLGLANRVDAHRSTAHAAARTVSWQGIRRIET